MRLGWVTGRVEASTNGFIGLRGPDNAVGALLIAASTSVEDTAAGKEVNPFVQRLIDVLSGKGSPEEAVMAYDAAKKMQKPIISSASEALPTVYPVAVTVGADFSVIRKRP